MQIDNEKLISLDRNSLDYLVRFFDRDKLLEKLNAFYKSSVFRTKYKINSKKPLKKDANTFKNPDNVLILLDHIFAQKLDNAEIIDILDDLVRESLGLETKGELAEEELDEKCRICYENDLTESKSARVIINALYYLYGLDAPDYAKIESEESIPSAETASKELEEAAKSLISDKKGESGEEKENAKKAAPARKVVSPKKIVAAKADTAAKKDAAKKKSTADIDKKDQTIETLKKNYNKLVNSVKNVDPSEVNDYEVDQIVDLEALSDSVKQETEHFVKCIENGDYENARKTLAYLYVLVSATEDSKHE